MTFIDAGPNCVKAPFTVARACERLIETADRAGTNFSYSMAEREIGTIAAMKDHMSIPTDPMALFEAVHDSLMPKPGSRDFRQELPALHEAFVALGDLAINVVKPEPFSLAEISFHGSEPLPKSPELPAPILLLGKARTYLQAFEALPEQSALRGPFMR